MVQKRLRLAALFVGGILLAALIMAELPNEGAGYALRPVVLWLAMYPFVIEASVPRRFYWLLLVGGVPLGLALDNSGPLRAYLMIGTLVIFVISVLVTFGRQLQRFSRS